MSRVALRLLNGIYGFVVGAVILAAAVISGYSIWDNTQVYRRAENVQNQIRQLKPEIDEEGKPNFDELSALNEDVVAWITVDGTNIDYPVLQGEDNLTYMNKDVYGEFSLAGSIFLDYRNKADFSDNYSLIYGHNMDKHLMFGDLVLFKDKEFFAENKDAVLLMINGISRELNTVSVLQISAGTDEIFNPHHWDRDLKGFSDFLKENSIWYHTDMVDKLEKNPNKYGVVALATCSDGNTNDRTVLILIYEKDTGGAEDDNPEDIPVDKPDEPEITTADSNSITAVNTTTTTIAVDGNGPKPTGDDENRKLWILVIAGVAVFIAIFETADYIRKKNSR